MSYRRCENCRFRKGLYFVTCFLTGRMMNPFAVCENFELKERLRKKYFGDNNG